MTQTDYDKALTDFLNEYADVLGCNIEDIPGDQEDCATTAFRKGYEYGKQLSTTDHERKKVRTEIAMRAMQELLIYNPDNTAAERIAEQSVAYTDALLSELEK